MISSDPSQLKFTVASRVRLNCLVCYAFIVDPKIYKELLQCVSLLRMENSAPRKMGFPD